MLDFRTSREPVAKGLLTLTGNEGEDAPRIRLGLAHYLLARAQSPPSPGYEPLLIKRGENPVLARAKAYLTVSEGRRIAAESRRLRDVAAAIRFLAKPGRSPWAVARKIGLLFAASNETRIIRTIFTEAGLNDSILIPLLPLAVQGNEPAIEGVLRIASMAAPRICIPRGPKVTAASAAHELFLEKHGTRRAQAYTYSDLDEDFVDEATQATRLEFSDAVFGPQSASRRLKARRRLAGLPAQLRRAKARSQNAQEAAASGK
jgi:hypothetical protein